MTNSKTYIDDKCYEINLEKAFWGDSDCPMFVEITQADGYKYSRRVWVDANGIRYIKSRYDATRVGDLESTCRCKAFYF